MTAWPSTMLAARLHEFGGSPVVEKIAAPRPRPGWDLVLVQAAPLSHLDLTIASGRFAIRPTLPHTGGTQAIGTVVDADGFSASTQVLVRGHGVGTLTAGCWAEYVLAPRDAITQVEPDLPPEQVAAYPLPTSTAYVAVHDVAKVRVGERVIVTGAAGAVGGMAAQLALLAGAKEVLGIVSRPERVSRIPAGVRPVVGRGEQLLEALEACSRAQVVIDTVGGSVLADVLKGGIERGGRVALVGYTAGTRLSLDLPSWLHSEISLLPVNMMSRSARSIELAPMLAALVRSGGVRVDVEQVRWSGLPAALERLAHGDVHGRAVLMPQLETERRTDA